MATIEQIYATVHSCQFDGVAVTQGVGNMVKRDLVLVRVVASDGTVGYGEAHMGLNPTAIAEVINHSIAPQLVGRDSHDVEGCWQAVYRHQIVTHGLGAGSVIAMSGVDIALWDLRGKLLGLPVYKLMGGSKKRLRAYAGGMGLGWQPDTDLEREIGKLVDQGYTAVKLRIGQGIGPDSSKVRHIRKVFGDTLDIAVDAATRYTQSDIAAVTRFCEDGQVLWLEEPFAPDDLHAYAELRQATQVPIAAGENHFTKHAFRDLLERRAITILQPDSAKAGGLTETKKIADMGAAWHLQVAPHTSQSVIGTAANVHLLCAISNGLIYEADISARNPWRDDLATNPLKVEKGFIEPNDLPGLGLEIDEAMLEAYPAIPGASYVPPARTAAA
ncbi:mandelate racemase/muconate lactonizing enzyme family protein [Leisingera daeponensis]|uniref:Mandelate racemase/muconate lactonizing enzyme family protein n=1 Tax=Leisingera daeponensis TaxID=405746 RepID=A0ABS7NDN0_9RHOB|nr:MULTISPECIES: mandelate racemase/muconate lactonizing enzyme family protein [Leisingera]MBY6139318.1 mandelate racemase/muconate lactonizing enzyme family protein [Leisingera daeponensis]